MEKLKNKNRVWTAIVERPSVDKELSDGDKIKELFVGSYLDISECFRVLFLGGE